MIEVTPGLARTIDDAIAENLQATSSPHPVVSVHGVAQAVMYASGASADDLPAILHLVCQRSIYRGHVLAFAGHSSNEPH